MSISCHHLSPWKRDVKQSRFVLCWYSSTALKPHSLAVVTPKKYSKKRNFSTNVKLQNSRKTFNKIVQIIDFTYSTVQAININFNKTEM